MLSAVLENIIMIRLPIVELPALANSFSNLVKEVAKDSLSYCFANFKLIKAFASCARSLQSLTNSFNRPSYVAMFVVMFRVTHGVKFLAAMCLRLLKTAKNWKFGSGPHDSTLPRAWICQHGQRSLSAPLNSTTSITFLIAGSMLGLEFWVNSELGFQVWFQRFVSLWYYFRKTRNSHGLAPYISR